MLSAMSAASDDGEGVSGPESRGRRVAVLVARLLLGAVFVLAGSYKLFHPADFLTTLWYMPTLRVLHVAAYGPLTGAIIAVELFLGFMFLLNREPRLTAYLGFLLLSAFTTMVGLNHEALSRHCSCFWKLGGLLPASLAGMLARNAILLFVAGYLVASQAKEGAMPVRGARG
jgi:uncharacterized membrane protein YphA (DoxX/SURF4 family)